jgi:NADPH:quinone reductase-like Zn-dependent oxidoreductase
MSSNKALFVNENGAIIVRSDLPPGRPEPGELLIEVFYSGVNPSDVKSTRVLHDHGNVLGVDFSGRVLEAPADSGYAAGDIVAGYTPTGSRRPFRYGAHQPFLAVPPNSGIFKVPTNMPYEDAAAFMVTVQTASDGLFNRLSLPVPTEASVPGSLPITVVIWGGGTSVGLASIQLARAAGVSTIITTASPSRHQMLKDFGATHCFDYRDPDVKSAVRRAIDEAGHTDVRGFETAATADAYRLFLDILTALPKEPPLCFCWVMTDERPQSETVLGGRHYDVVLTLPGGQDIVFEARPVEGETIFKAVDWAVAHYGNGFRLPAVRIFEGTAEDALAVLEDVAALATFGKAVLKHPLK